MKIENTIILGVGGGVAADASALRDDGERFKVYPDLRNFADRPEDPDWPAVAIVPFSANNPRLLSRKISLSLAGDTAAEAQTMGSNEAFCAPVPHGRSSLPPDMVQTGPSDSATDLHRAGLGADGWHQNSDGGEESIRHERQPRSINSACLEEGVPLTGDAGMGPFLGVQGLDSRQIAAVPLPKSVSQRPSAAPSRNLTAEGATPFEVGQNLRNTSGQKESGSHAALTSGSHSAQIDATPTDALGLRAVPPFTNGASQSPQPHVGAPQPEWAGGADTGAHSAESRHLPNTKAPHALAAAAAVGQPKAEAAMAGAEGDPDIRELRGQLSDGDRLSRRPTDRSLTAPAASQKTDPVNGGPALPNGEPDTEDLLSEVDDSVTDGQHISDARRSETGAANRATHASPFAREIATQVVAAAVRTSSDRDFTEITLDPEDLGKIKIQLRTEGGTPTLS